MKRFGLVMIAVALCVVAARPATAQGVRYGVSAGLLMPMGNYGDADKLGFVGGAGATYWLAGQPIGIRGDLSYSQTSHDASTGLDGHTKILGGMASVVYALNPASAPARIMLNAGVGYYNVKFDDTSLGSTSESKIGFGGGAAVAFKMGTGSTRLVLGTRFTSVSTSGGSSLTFLPITVGLTFGK
jgi:outer membrane protein with beta-barrel domain